MLLKLVNITTNYTSIWNTTTQVHNLQRFNLFYICLKTNSTKKSVKKPEICT